MESRIETRTGEEWHYNPFHSKTLADLEEVEHKAMTKWNKSGNFSDFGLWTGALANFTKMKAEFGAVFRLIEWNEREYKICTKQDLGTLPNVVNKMLKDGLIKQIFGTNPGHALIPQIVITEEGRKEVENIGGPSLDSILAELQVSDP